MKDLVVERLAFEVPADYMDRWPSMKIGEWGAKVDALIQLISGLASESRALGS